MPEKKSAVHPGQNLDLRGPDGQISGSHWPTLIPQVPTTPTTANQGCPLGKHNSETWFMKHVDHGLSACEYLLKEGSIHAYLEGRRDRGWPCRRGSRPSASAPWEPAARPGSRPCAPLLPARPPGATQWSSGRPSPCGETQACSETPSLPPCRKEAGPAWTWISNQTGCRLERAQPDPLFRITWSEDVTHFRPWVKILLAGKVPVNINALGRAEGTRHFSKCNWAENGKTVTSSCRSRKEWGPLKEHSAEDHVEPHSSKHCLSLKQELKCSGNWTVNLLGVPVNKVTEEKTAAHLEHHFPSPTQVFCFAASTPGLIQAPSLAALLLDPTNPSLTQTPRVN